MSTRHAWLVAIILGSGCRPTQQPTELTRVIDAVDHAGLVRKQAFVDTQHVDRDSPQFRRQLDSGFLALPSGAASIILRTDRFQIAVDSATSFTVSAYSPNGRLSLVQVFAPLVNGSEQQNAQMLATIDSVAVVLAADTTGVHRWVDSSWQAVWRDWEHSRTRDDRIKEKRFGNYRMVVSGVPPDFVFFAAVRMQ